MNHKEFSIWLEGFLCNKTVLQTDEILIIREKLSKIKEENIPYNIENFRDNLFSHKFPNITVPPPPKAPKIICGNNDK